jgi:DNA invertase Pin-like site-specific DNA recombinase
MHELFTAISAFWAKLERQRIAERIHAGQERARAAGVRFGRPLRSVDLEDVRRRREAGESWRRIARALKVPTRTLRRHAEAGRMSTLGREDEAPRKPAPVVATAPGGQGGEG